MKSRPTARRPRARHHNSWFALGAALSMLLAACNSSTDRSICDDLTDSANCASGTIDVAPRQIQAPLPIGEPTETVALTALGEDVFLLLSQGQPRRIVQMGQPDGTSDVVWSKHSQSDHLRGQGHTAICRDIDGDGDVEVIDVYYALEGDLLTTYHETLQVNGQHLGESTRRIDGNSVPREITEICGYPMTPIPNITALQLTALLERVGFTGIEGDHRIDPTWTATATINGETYTIALDQTEAAPDPAYNTQTCALGTLHIDPKLPADIRALLTEAADCTDW